MYKVYFDYNIYREITRNMNIRNKINNNNEFKYFFSGAIAEEVYKRIKNDNGKHETEIKEEIQFINDLTNMSGLRDVQDQGTIVYKEDFKKALKRVEIWDTTDLISNLSIIKNQFKGSLKNSNTAYVCSKDEKEIWELDEVKKYIGNFMLDTIDYNNVKSDFKYVISIIDKLLLILNIVGYYREKNNKMESSIHDESHIRYASNCDIFVTNDKRLMAKAKAIYYKIKSNTKVYNLNDFTSLL